MKTSTKNKIIATIGIAATLLVLSFNNWNTVDMTFKLRYWFLLNIPFSIVVAIYFACGFLYHYNVRPLKKWLIPAAVVVYITPPLINIFLESDLRYIITAGFYISCLLIGIRVLVWGQESNIKKKE